MESKLKEKTAKVKAKKLDEHLVVEDSRRDFVKKSSLVAAGLAITTQTSFYGMELDPIPEGNGAFAGFPNKDNANVLIVYTTDFGSTRTMSEAVEEGAKSVEGVNVVRKMAADATMEDTVAADGVIAGSPMKHRNMHSRLKEYIERVWEKGWLTDNFVGKVGGVFSVGGGHGNNGAGCELAQLSILSAMAANGMILTPFPKITPGADFALSHWGPSGRTGGIKMMPQKLAPEMLEAAYHHGANVARLTKALKGNQIFAAGNVSPSPEVLRMFTSG